MLMGNAPFSGKDDNETFQKIADFDFNDDQKFQALSESAKDLIRNILKTESNDRMEYEDILAHEWFQTPAKDEETKDNTSMSSIKENMSVSSNLPNSYKNQSVEGSSSKPVSMYSASENKDKLASA